MKDYDRHREGEILESDFKRALDNSSVIIKEEEATILCNMWVILQIFNLPFKKH